MALKPLAGKAWLIWKLPGPWTPVQPGTSLLPYLLPELWGSEWESGSHTAITKAQNSHHCPKISGHLLCLPATGSCLLPLTQWHPSMCHEPGMPGAGFITNETQTSNVMVETEWCQQSIRSTWMGYRSLCSIKRPLNSQERRVEASFQEVASKPRPESWLGACLKGGGIVQSERTKSTV